MISNKIYLLLFVGLASILTAASAGDGWLTDFETAKAQAKAEGKPLLMEFTGSDWCPPCMRLNKEVFSQDAFNDYASESLVLLKLDFPRKKRLSDEQRAHNVAIRDEFGIRGYPTILLLSPEGELLGRTGYRRGGAERYVDHLKSIVAGE